MCKGQPISNNRPILSQVRSNSVITVKKKCSISIEWNSQRKSIEYYPPIPISDILIAAIKGFHIQNSSSEFYFMSGNQKRIENDYIIPFDGIKDSTIKLLRNTNMSFADCSSSSEDEIQEISISVDDELIKYTYKPNTTIQFYFDKVIDVSIFGTCCNIGF